MLGIPEHRVRVIMGDVGGAFGQKMFMVPDELAVVRPAGRLGRPVKWIEDRRENLMAGLHARDDRMTVELRGRRRRADPRRPRPSWSRTSGAFPAHRQQRRRCSSGWCCPARTGSRSSGSRAKAVYTNTCGRCSYRGPWMMETVAREQMMDVVARAIGIDPLEFRRRNVVTAADLPYTTAAGMYYDDISTAESLEQAAEMIGYDGAARRAGAARADGAVCVGIGLSLYVEPSGPVDREPVQRGGDGPRERQRSGAGLMSSASHGQSVETTVAQVVADELGYRLRRGHGRSRATPRPPRTGRAPAAAAAR